MHTRIAEIADGIFRLSTFVPEVAPPAGFTFNQFLIRAEEPLLFHCGHRFMHAPIAEAVAQLIPLGKLRWISFSHFEADESGSMNAWLAAAPRSEVTHGTLGCDVSIRDAADRPPRPLADREVIDLGGRRVRYLATPHVPHGWDAGLMYEETTRTLLCSDLLGQVGDPAPVAGMEIIDPALDAEAMFRSMSVTPATVSTLRMLADLSPRTLAIMHGSSFAGDGAAALRTFASAFDRQLARAA